jgi:hypothetical protein
MGRAWFDERIGSQGVPQNRPPRHSFVRTRAAEAHHAPPSRGSAREPIVHGSPRVAVGRARDHDDVAAVVLEAVKGGVQSGGVPGGLSRQGGARSFAYGGGLALQRTHAQPA